MHSILAQAAEASNTWPIVATVVGVFAGITNGVVLLYLQQISKRQDVQEAKIDKLMDQKNLCNQDYVGKVDYIRAVNRLEQLQEKLLEKMSEMTGTIEIVRQMPQMVKELGIVIAREMRKNGE
jgi:hypothetical protein